MKKSPTLIIVACASLVGSLITYFYLPEIIPIHWNFAGKSDSWAPKWVSLLLGAIPLALAILMEIFPKIDPKKNAYLRHGKTYDVMRTLIVLMMIAFVWVGNAAALGFSVNIGVIIRVLVGILFMGIGNFMGRLKRNYFVGIKTPWTLADDKVWRKTHRRGGWVFIIMGMMMILSIAISSGPVLGFTLGLIVISGVSYIFVYSYLEWRRSNGEKSSRATKGDSKLTTETQPPQTP